MWVLATVWLAQTMEVHFLTYLGARSPETKVLIFGVGPSKATLFGYRWLSSLCDCFIL